MLAAASATVEARAAYQGRRVREVQQFARRASFGQTEGGSFVVKVLVPLPPYLPGTQLDFEFPDGVKQLPERPFNRKVTEMLLLAATSAYQAANRASLEQSLNPFSEYVRFGVSADFCRALSSMICEDSPYDELSIAVNWSRSWAPQTDRQASVVFAQDVLRVLGEASKFLSEVEPQEGIELAGYVTRLHKEHKHESGEVTIYGRVDAKWRKVKVRLSGEDYKCAIQAHDKEEPLAWIPTSREPANV